MKIKIHFSAYLIFTTLLLSHPILTLAALLAAFIHEMGHIFSAKILNISFQELQLTPFGAGLIPKNHMGSYADECIIAASGPFWNLLCFFLFFPFADGPSLFRNAFLFSSLLFALLNLLPITGFDGGRLLICILTILRKKEPHERIFRIISFIFIFILWLFSVYLLLKFSSSLSLFIFSCSLFHRLFLS